MGRGSGKSIRWESCLIGQAQPRAVVKGQAIPFCSQINMAGTARRTVFPAIRQPDDPPLKKKERDDMDCKNCKNYAPVEKKPPWKPKVGDKVHWDGVFVYEDGSTDQHPPGDFILVRSPKTVSPSYTVGYCFKNDCWTTREHISPIPEEKQRWNAGDYAYTKKYGIAKISSICADGAYAVVLLEDGNKMCVVMIDSLRPLTDADWTGDIDGVKVRAYADRDGYPHIHIHDTFMCFYGTADMQRIGKAICSRFNIPIMPDELSKGIFKSPE